jgi:hypothetical protein
VGLSDTVADMTEERFWELIALHVDVDEEFKVDVFRLQAALTALPAEEIVSFEEVLQRFYWSSYSSSLWGAAYLINGGCSDDGFDYFRGWLIAQGRDVFEAALKDPETLADHSSEDVECGSMLYVAPRAYEAATGHEIPYRASGSADVSEGGDTEEEDDWDFDDEDEMKRRYPRLFVRYGAR